MICQKKLPKRYIAQYTTLECLFRKWKAFKFMRRRTDRTISYVLQISDHNDVGYIRNCERFCDFVDLYTKQSGIYRVY